MLPSAEMLVDTQKGAVDKTSLIRWKLFPLLCFVLSRKTVVAPLFTLDYFFQGMSNFFVIA